MYMVQLLEKKAEKTQYRFRAFLAFFFTKIKMASIFDDDAFAAPRNNATVLQLFNAASRNRVDVVMQVLTTCDSSTYDIQDEVNGISSFLIACKKGHVVVVEAFLKHDASLVGSMQSETLRNGLMISAFEGHEPCVQLLAQFDESKGAVDAAGNGALHYAAWGGKLKVVQYLIEEGGCDPAAANAEGLSPLQFAAAGNHVDIVQYLTGRAAPSASVSGSEAGPAGSLGAARSESGYNALHRAAMCGALEALQLLLPPRTTPTSSSSSSSCPTDSLVEVKAANGSTCLHLAAHHGHLDVVTYLAEQHSADVHAANDFGLTPLMLACVGGHSAVARYLVVDRRADLAATNAAGANALHLAAASGRHDICELLYEHSCNAPAPADGSSGGGVLGLLALDAEGSSPIDAALASGYKELAAKLAMWSSVELRARRLASILR